MTARDDINNKFGLVEKYAFEMIVMIIFAMMTWNVFTTYQNALALERIITTLTIMERDRNHVLSEITSLLATTKDHERRIQHIEDTRWTSKKHEEFEKNIEEKLNRKQDKK